MPTQETNANGEATFDLAEGNYVADASEQGYQQGSTSFSIGSGESITRTITLQESDPAVLTIAVSNGDTGGPIDATVSVGGQSGSTGSDGQISFNLAGGDYEVVASSGGYVSDSTPVSLDWGEERTISIALTPEEEPTLVDDFERDPIDPWVNIHEEGTECIIQQSSGLNSTNGMYVPAPGEAEVTAGLENFPSAGGGPSNNGAWECYVRLESTGGASDIFRVNFAEQSSARLRWQVQSDYARLAGPNNSLDFYVGISQGDTRILRIHEWRTDGFIDCSIRNASDTELDRQSTTFGSAPTSGGMSVETNYSTAGSIDSIYLLE